MTRAHTCCDQKPQRQDYPNLEVSKSTGAKETENSLDPRPESKNDMEFTGERFIPSLDIPEISYEHWHRYLFASQFAAGKTILDIACGEGYGSALLAQTAQRVIGVDISADTIQAAQKKYQQDNLEFKIGSLDSFPIEEQAVFDAIISFESIEHISREEQEKFLLEAKRVLKPGGILYISTPNKLLYTDRPNFHNEFHIQEFYIPDFRTFLGKAFKHVALFGQKTYTGSFIWKTENNNSPVNKEFTEFQLTNTGHGFSPTENAKEDLYCIAICSDVSLNVVPDSLMVDLSDQYPRMLKTLYDQLSERVVTANTIAARLEEVTLNYEREIEYQRAEFARTKAELNRAKSELEACARSRIEFAEVSARLDQITGEYERTKNKLDQAESELVAYANSTSWKITRPLRKTVNFIRRR